MIGKIKGILSEIDGNIGLVETTSGIFYEVYLTSHLTSHVGVGEPIEAYTYHHIREDIQLLFGFKEKNEHHAFKLLLSVSGVGPKTAFTVISYTGVDPLIAAVTSNDVEYFSKIPGLGKKTAMKIVLELSQKFNTEFKLEKMHLSENEKTIVDALVSLGFKSSEAKNILPQISKDLPLEEQVRQAIRLATHHK